MKIMNQLYGNAVQNASSDFQLQRESQGHAQLRRVQ